MNGSIKYNINISIKNNTRLKFSQQKPLNTAGQVKQKASKSSSAFFCLGFTVLDEALLCSFFSSTTLASSSVGELLQLARAQELYIEVCYQDTEVAIRRSRLAAASSLAAAPTPDLDMPHMCKDEDISVPFYRVLPSLAPTFHYDDDGDGDAHVMENFDFLSQRKAFLLLRQISINISFHLSHRPLAIFVCIDGKDCEKDV